MELEIKEPVELIYHARVYPADKQYGEFDCAIMLTDKHLFVTEDNDDGSFVIRYMFDFEHVLEVKISRPFATSDDYMDCAGSSGERKKYDSTLRGGLLYRLFGLRPVGSSGGKKGRAKDKYLEVVYLDISGKKEHLYFNNFDKMPRELVKRFELI